MEEFLREIDDSSVGFQLHFGGVGLATSGLESAERHAPVLFLSLMSLCTFYFMSYLFRLL